jgi:hypothetical protein
MALEVSFDPNKEVYTCDVQQSRIKDFEHFDIAMMKMTGGGGWGYNAAYNGDTITVKTNDKKLDVLKELKARGVLKW